MSSGPVRPNTLRALQNTVTLIEKASGRRSYQSRLLQSQVGEVPLSEHPFVQPYNFTQTDREGIPCKVAPCYCSPPVLLLVCSRPPAPPFI
jgi:hypothetical protein